MADAVSDYGSDFGDDDAALLAQCVDEIEALRHHAATTAADAVGLESPPGGVVVVPTAAAAPQPAPALATRLKPRAPAEAASPPPATTPALDELPAHPRPTQSPLERFRTPPKKPLSVTDLVSPAWCEQQYAFSLAKFGRVRATPAMQRGSSVHRALEEQVHAFVPVDVATREDGWGLKLWNVVQGLRALRVTGMTRELEVFGTVDGLVITGVVDELSFRCSDAGLERSLEAEGEGVGAEQTTIRDFFAARAETLSGEVKASPDDSRKVYLTDVKTRKHASLPNAVSLRPTQMQLMLYHRLLAQLVDNHADAAAIFARYALDPTAPFSPSLIQQLAALDLNLRPHATESSLAPVESAADTRAELTAHDTLAKLWTLMIREYQLTLPRGSASLSRVLQAEYRAAGDGRVIGAKTFVFERDRIEAYIAREMDWWRGRRPAQGVDVEEAFKCRLCEFADECEWRIGKIEEATKRARLQKPK